MAWTLSGNGSTVNFEVLAGDIIVNQKQDTAILWPLRGASPIVQSGSARVPSLETPEWLSTSNSQHLQIMSIITSGSRITITTDTGEVFNAVVSGDVVFKIEDTPDRDIRPRRRYIVPLVGVN